MFFTIFPALLMNFLSNSALGVMYPGSTIGLSPARASTPPPPRPRSLARAPSDERPGTPRPGRGLPARAGPSPPLVDASIVSASSSASRVRSFTTRAARGGFSRPPSLSVTSMRIPSQYGSLFGSPPFAPPSPPPSSASFE